MSGVHSNITGLRTGDGERLVMPPSKAGNPYETLLTSEADQTRLQYLDQFVTKKGTVAGFDRVIPSGFQSIHRGKYEVAPNSWLRIQPNAEMIIL